MLRMSSLVVVVWLSLFSNPLAADWPQWAGPDRDFTAPDADLADSWPAEGPRQLWSRELGVGYSGIVVADGTLYTMYRKNRTDAIEYTVALDAATGKTIWEFEHRAPLAGPPAEPSDTRWGGQGPNATPLIVGNRLYTMGSRAVMHCHDRKSGKVLWKRDLAEEFGATQAGRKNNDTGYPSSPIAYKSSVIVPLGRSRVKKVEAGQSLVALDLADGEVLWKQLDFEYGFASPALIELNGQDQLVLQPKGELIGVNPADGRLLWRHRMDSAWDPTTSPVWNRANGVLVKDGEDACLIELAGRDGKTTPRKAWSSPKLDVLVPTPVLVGDTFYGATKSMLVAVNAKTGEHLWTERGFPMASILHADGKLILLDENGQLTLATATPKGLTIRSQGRVTEKYSLTAPALVGTRLFVRDRKQIVALDLG
jgi:outer membrane protein assembly factor BamB